MFLPTERALSFSHVRDQTQPKPYSQADRSSVRKKHALGRKTWTSNDFSRWAARHPARALITNGEHAGPETFDYLTTMIPQS